MSGKFKSFFGTLSKAVLAMYPILVFYFLIIQKVPIRIFSLFIMAIALFDIIARVLYKPEPAADPRQGQGSPQEKKHGLDFLNSLLLLVMGVLGFIINTNMVHKFSPVMMNIILLYTFGITLFQPPVMIYRFAILVDKSIPKSLGEKEIAAYCYKVTVIWVVFFILNGSIAALTVFYGSDLLWAVYNSVVSPVIIGCLFVGEFIVRKIVHKKIPKAVPLSSFKKNSRNLSNVMCYEGTWNDGIYKTWGDFIKETSALRKKIETVEGNRWFLYCEDCWHFLLAFTALLQCKKEIILSFNVSPACITEISGDANILTDHIFPIDGIERYAFEKTFLIPSILSENAHEGISKCPKIISDKTSIVLFNPGGEPADLRSYPAVSAAGSGSPEKTKAMELRLTNLENDNARILSMWGRELLNRKFCSTVNHHHIYGFLFSILLPFTAGIPFRRQRVQVPEEFMKLNDTEYTIITSAEFLKRGVEILRPNGVLVKSPWIFVPDCELDLELAGKTSEIFGSWPIEINSSTDTPGITWRQSNKGNEWKPFDNV
ncbi:MAG: acyl-CoA synthetase [Treponema sp.]|nr:acyl-CoA synthetase [Treponema sp.]